MTVQQFIDYLQWYSDPDGQIYAEYDGMFHEPHVSRGSVDWGDPEGVIIC